MAHSELSSLLADGSHRLLPFDDARRIDDDVTLTLPALYSCAAGSIQDGQLVTDIRRLIDEAKTHAATAINAALTLLYWRVGNRIRREILGGTRAFTAIR